MGNEHPVATGLKVLTEILDTQRRRGQETVHMAPESGVLLSKLPRTFMEAGRKEREQAIQSIRETPAPVTDNAGTVSGVDVQNANQSNNRHPLSEEEVRAALNKIFKEVKSSEECRALGTLFETIVFATGNPMADIMFVGEAPGADEEKLKKPFVGPSGQKLNQMLTAMGVKREEVYISNIVKYRPKKGDGRLQGNSNRAPTADEMRVCMPFITREIEVVRPKVIVALGKTAAEGLLDRGGTLGSFRNQTHEVSGVPVVVTYHPSWVLRQERESNPEGIKKAKRSVWEDMLRVMELAGLEISEKQRGYFL